ncbi:MAG TPA: MJ0042-type zinc finger domain-containing protein, partial [Burkholderiaceae bacterium]|nr:MJ0042-type zinc finger domain-containing protein [Burkholderiaceae bacterium]
MALATTCPQCKTSFKVVPDQLKLRRGLVRCGVCQHVFSGIDYLRYVDEATRAAQKASARAPDAASGLHDRPSTWAAAAASGTATPGDPAAAGPPPEAGATRDGPEAAARPGNAAPGAAS